MPNGDTAFWRALLGHPCEHAQRVRPWNGYIGWKMPPRLRAEKPRSGWPHNVVHAPPGGWPELTVAEISESDTLAKEHGGHPTWRERPYMDFPETCQRQWPFQVGPIMRTGTRGPHHGPKPSSFTQRSDILAQTTVQLARSGRHFGSEPRVDSYKTK